MTLLRACCCDPSDAVVAVRCPCEDPTLPPEVCIPRPVLAGAKVKGPPAVGGGVGSEPTPGLGGVGGAGRELRVVRVAFQGGGSGCYGVTDRSCSEPDAIVRALFEVCGDCCEAPPADPVCDEYVVGDCFDCPPLFSTFRVALVPGEIVYERVDQTTGLLQWRRTITVDECVFTMRLGNTVIAGGCRLECPGFAPYGVLYSGTLLFEDLDGSGSDTSFGPCDFLFDRDCQPSQVTCLVNCGPDPEIPGATRQEVAFTMSSALNGELAIPDCFTAGGFLAGAGFGGTFPFPVYRCARSTADGPCFTGPYPPPPDGEVSPGLFRYSSSGCTVEAL